MDLLGLIRRAGGLLTGSPWFSRRAHAGFLWIYRRRGWRYLYQVSVSLGFTVATSRIIALHKLPETPTWDLVTALGTAIIVTVALIVASLPLAIVAHGWRSGRGRDRHMANQLSGVLSRCHGPTEGLLAEDAIPALIESLRHYHGAIVIISPNALYLLGDRWLPTIEPRLERDVVKQRLRSVAQYAPAFRDILLSHRGPLHWVLPDPRDSEVRVLLADRGQSLGLESAWIAEANREALRWLQGDLSRGRRELGGKTFVHLCGFVPRFRLLLTDEECWFQKFPGDGYGFMTRIYRMNKHDDFSSHAAFKLALTSWCGIG